MTPDTLFSMDLQPIGEFMPDLLLMKFSQGIVEQADKTKLNYSSTYVHELTHWMQFAGTNWGNMQMILMQSATNSLVNTSTYGDIKYCLEGLKHISLSKDFQVLGPKTNKYAATIFQNWQDSFITKKIFGTGTSELFKIPNCSKSIAVGLCDYTNTINYKLGKEEDDISNLESFFSFPDYRFLQSAKHGEITVLDLIEGQAKINDVLHKIALSIALNGNSQFQIDFITFFEDRYQDIYSKAFKVYCEYGENKIVFGNIDNLYSLIEECIKFCIIIDISLAIDIPPFIANNKYPAIEWKQIYPTIRFAQLIKAASKVTFDFGNSLDKIKYNQFVAKLCEETGFTHPMEQAAFFLDHYEIEIKKIESRLSLRTISLAKVEGFMDYLIYLFIQFNKLKITNPEIICLPGLGGNESNFLELQWEEDNYWLHCPFHMTGNVLGNTLPSQVQGFSGLLLGLIVSNRVTEQHLMRSVPLPKVKFPFAINATLQGLVSSIHKKQYGVQLSWE